MVRGSESLEIVMEDFLQGIDELVKEKFILKGCMALKRHLPINNLSMNMRQTADIDFSAVDKESWEDLVNNCAEIATLNSTLGCHYQLLSRRGFDKNPNSDSLKIKYDNGQSSGIFKIDMNVKPGDSAFYVNMGTTSMKVYSISGILSDKLSVLLSPKLCRRIKDLIDVYYLSNSTIYLLDDLVEGLKDFESEGFILSPGNHDIIRHAYDKYKMDNVDKPRFEEVYIRVLSFIIPIYLKKFKNQNLLNVERWDFESGKWR